MQREATWRRILRGGVTRRSRGLLRARREAGCVLPEVGQDLGEEAGVALDQQGGGEGEGEGEGGRKSLRSATPRCI